VVCTALRREPDNTTNSVRNFSVLLLGRYFGKRLLDARRIDQDDLLPVFPGSAISLLNSRDLPTRCLAGVAETQL
jgi:hypothetical protein